MPYQQSILHRPQFILAEPENDTAAKKHTTPELTIMASFEQVPNKAHKYP